MADRQRILDSFYKTIIDSVYDMIYLHDLKGNIIDVNQRALEETGYSWEELTSIKVFDLHPDESNGRSDYDRNYVFKQWQDCAVGDAVNFEVEHISKDGKAMPVEIDAGKVENDGKEYMIAFVRDITSRKNKEDRIMYLSYHDVLTGLYNRRYFEEELETISQAMLPVSIIMADLNGLKIVNNSSGHTTGDKVLVKAAEILEEQTPEKGTVARFGGDEFVVLLPETDNKEAHQVFDEIKEACSETETDNFPVSLGMGIATMTEIDQDINHIFEKADREMNHNKLLETRSANHKIVSGLLGALSAKSDETVEHTERMTQLARKIGQRLGVHNSQLNRLSLLAALHDIGKTSIPEEVLNKPGPLTKEEWKMIEGHPARGYKIASATSEFAVIAEEILSHHERWDGKGYPRELAGQEIPYLARIITVVDAFDVMISGRPYQEGISKEEALTEIEDCAGSQFDPEIAGEFIKLFREVEV
ncbi:MAG: HD domain-containing phosphohydrolase [Halarsenatibacteraceae bacterium]